MIYVDPLMQHGWKLRGRIVLSCHLLTDSSEEELHIFAEKIGMKRKWFQPKPGFPHYDLTHTRREKAVILGAEEIRGKRLLEIFQSIRAKFQK